MPILRLDKFLANAGIGSRSDVKGFIKSGKIKVDGICVKKADIKIDTEKSTVLYNDKKIDYEEFVYFMLNKPQGVVSATFDKFDKTVVDIIEEAKHMEIFPVGRLDKDTEGLLILTNDGELAHNLLSPKKHIPKTYYARLDGAVTDEMKKRLCEGIELEDFTTMPAKIAETDADDAVEITIMEGKFHQVKRMFKAVGLNVLYLKRIAMGDLDLDSNLDCGKYRRLTEKEINILKGSNN